MIGFHAYALVNDQRGEDEIDEVSRSLQRRLRQRGASRQDAEDIAQQSWLAAIRKPLRRPGSLRSWLFVVASRLLNRSRLANLSRADRELLSALEAGAWAESESGADAPSLLARYVDELPDPYARTIRLRFYEGLEVEEIAARLSIPPATVRTHLKRGLARLRERIGQDPEQRRRLSSFGWLTALWRRPKEKAASKAALGAAVVAVVLLSVIALWSIEETRSAPAAAHRGLADVPRQLERIDEPLGPAAPTADRARSSRVAIAPTSARLRGRVLTPDGRPVVGAVVHALDPMTPLSESRTTTDAEGRYEIDPRELVWASHTLWRESSRCYVASLLGETTLDLVLGATRGRAEVVVRSHEGHPVAAVHVRIESSAGALQLASERGTLELEAPPEEASTDADGVASLLFPEARTVHVSVVSDGTFTSAWIPTPSPGERVEIALPEPLTLRGTCVDLAGLPIAGAHVEVVQLGGRVRREARSDPQGEVVVEGLSPGDFLLRATEAPPGRLSYRHEARLSPGETGPLRLLFEQRATVWGSVLQRGEPLAGARVELIVARPIPADGILRATTTDAQGRFVFGGAPMTVAHSLHVFRPGESSACFGRARVRPGREDVVCPLPEAARIAPIELAYEGPETHRPRLIEIRRWHATISALVTVAPGEDRWRTPPMPPGEYEIISWHPGIGTWDEGRIEHNPSAERVHVLEAPEWGEVEVQVPAGAEREDVRVALLVPAFDRNRLSPSQPLECARVVPWREDRSAFVAPLPAGRHELVVSGAGIAESHHSLETFAGRTTHLSVAIPEGLEVILVFLCAPPTREPGRIRSRGMFPAEVLRLEAVTPTGSVFTELLGKDLRLVEGGFEFTVRIPATTVELRASTRADLDRKAPFVPREGSRALEPGELEARADPARIELTLVDR